MAVYTKISSKDIHLTNSKFDIDEDSLKIGMGMMAYLAINS